MLATLDREQGDGMKDASRRRGGGCAHNYYVSQYLEELWVGHLISCTRSGFFAPRLCLTKGAPVEWFRTDLAEISFVVDAHLS